MVQMQSHLSSPGSPTLNTALLSSHTDQVDISDSHFFGCCWSIVPSRSCSIALGSVPLLIELGHDDAANSIISESPLVFSRVGGLDPVHSTVSSDINLWLGMGP